MIKTFFCDAVLWFLFALEWLHFKPATKWFNRFSDWAYRPDWMGK